MDEINLTQNQLGDDGLPKWAVFLPATSSFYSAFIGRQRAGNHVPLSRIPSSLSNGIEGLNYLDPNGEFYYKWNLYSAGHADLGEDSISVKDHMIKHRDRNSSFTLGDSGGFQIAKTRWPADWKDTDCPRAKKKREQVLAWMDNHMDTGMVLDIPIWVTNSQEGKEKSGIYTFEDAVNGTKINNEFFIKNRNGNCKFLNVLQGETHSQADVWYEYMKGYCNPKLYPDNHFNGWAMGGQNKCDLHLLLKRLVTLKFDNLLEPGFHDHLHILGTSKLEWAVMLTDIQKAVREYYNPNFLITFDCASPFLATANGQIYHEASITDRGRWSYRMDPAVDNKQFKYDNRSFKQAIIDETKIEVFEDSPITKHLKLSDICVYGPGDLNKIGREGKTSWDSFSYTIQMAHNVWSHVRAVQLANMAYEKGITPKLLVQEKFNTVFVRDVINEALSLCDKEKALNFIDEYSRLWMEIPGNSGTVGKKTLNSRTMFDQFFQDTSHSEEFTEDEEELLEELETLEELE